MADAPDSDSVLMQRVQQGDLRAFETLVHRYKQPVANFIFRTLPDAAEAEDLTQAVFIQVYKSADRYRPSAKFTTWLFTIARNLSLNEIRRRSRHPAESMDAANSENAHDLAPQLEGDRAAEPDQVALQRELELKVEEAIRTLPETQRAAILLCRQDDLDYQDISESLGCSLSATKSLIHRARETLKEKLKPFLRTGTWDD